VLEGEVLHVAVDSDQLSLPVTVRAVQSITVQLSDPKISLRRSKNLFTPIKKSRNRGYTRPEVTVTRELLHDNY
jgi:hypothetical protein